MMKQFILILLFGLSLSLTAAEPASEMWSVEKANKWYDDQAWPCGFNYIPANTISYTEMWMPYAFDEKVMDKELALAEDIGFNCVRVVLPFVVWEHDPKAFKERIDKFLAICSKRGQNVMFCLFDDCAFGNDEKLKDPWYGKQPEVQIGWYANGWTPSPGHSMVRDSTTWPRLEKYVKDVIGSFKDDKRVWIWDVYNEPTNGGLGDVTLPLLSKVFDWARSVGPSQPLTAGYWNGNKKLNDLISAKSDISTFHNYEGAKALYDNIEAIRPIGRPIINTEWLNRAAGSLVETHLPIFMIQNVGCMHWGLVNGKTQTHLGWGSRPGKLLPASGAWQHDLYHGDFTPYNQKELDLFRKCIIKAKK